jgi:hypothetical protein
MEIRKAEMPKHCGNCAFFEWGDSSSACVHPQNISEEDEADLRNISDLHDRIEKINELLDEILSEDTPYNYVCDVWAARPPLTRDGLRLEGEMRDATIALYAQEVMMSHALTGEKA